MRFTHLRARGFLVGPKPREPRGRCDAHDMECPVETLDKIEPAVDITLHTVRLRECVAANKKKPATKIQMDSIEYENI